MGRRFAPALVALALAVGAGGCGEDTGVAGDATLTAYVEAPLCAAAGRALAAAGGRAGSFRVRVACLPGELEGGRLDLAQVGANARRASEDSAAIGYLGSPRGARFSSSILESADIGTIYGPSGGAAMTRLLDAIGSANTSSLRQSVRETVDPS